MKELILTNTNKVIRDAFIEDDAIYFHYKPILSNAKYRDGDPRTLAMQPHGSNEVIGDILKNYIELMEHFDDIKIKVISDDNDDQCYISYHHWSNDKDKGETVSFDICLRDEYIIYTTKHEKPYLEYYDNGVYTATTDDVRVVGKAIIKTLEEQVLWYISSGIR